MSEHVSFDPAVRGAYSADVSGLVMVPEAVARPKSEDEVVDVLRRAALDRMSVTAAGNQTSTTGASITDRGILLSMRAMDRIIDVDEANRVAVVEPGVLLGDLNRAVAQHQLHFAPDPTSMDDVTVGGAIACNASGARSLLYGTTRSHVRALQLVLASGENVEVRRSGLEKNTAGYFFAQEPVDWFVGSEGTLGIIVRAEVQLVPLPVRVMGLAIPCVDETTALRLVIAIRENPGLRPRCIEYFDEIAHGIARQRPGTLVYVEQELSWPGRSDGEGDRFAVVQEPDRDSALENWLTLAQEQGASYEDIEVFDGDAALRDARQFRHAVPAAMNERGSARRAHGGRKVSTDWAVAYQRLPDAIAAARRFVDDAGLLQPAIYGHAGNGHPHQNFIAHDAAELERIERVVEATLRHVVDMGGTVAAEHGIGKIKRRWLSLRATRLQLGAMAALKRELDPDGLLAPGNIL